MGNLEKIDKLFYRGLRICMGNDITYNQEELCSECTISNLAKRRDLHILLYMHKQSSNLELLKPCLINTRIHNAPVYLQYKPTNEKARLIVLYKGALLWNSLPGNRRAMEFKDFKKWLKNEIFV